MNSRSIYSIHSEAICNSMNRRIQSSFALQGLPSLTGEVAKSTYQLPLTKSQLLLDRLQVDKAISEMLKPWINWAPPGYIPGDLKKLKCQLYALQTDGDGNCLLHACALSMFGNHDRHQILRNLLSNLLLDEKFGQHFKSIWMDAEKYADKTLGEAAVERDDYQFEKEWEGIVNTAVNAGEYLGGFHIFLLAHILRRPIIVYGDGYVRDRKGDRYAPNNLRGVFLPTELGAELIFKVPITIGYTLPYAGAAGHFSALVGMEGELECLPLGDEHGEFLPIHYAVKHLPKMSDSEECIEFYKKFLETDELQPPQGPQYLMCKIPQNVPQITECRRTRALILRKAEESLRELASVALEVAEEAAKIAQSEEVTGEDKGQQIRPDPLEVNEHKFSSPLTKGSHSISSRDTYSVSSRDESSMEKESFNTKVQKDIPSTGALDLKSISALSEDYSHHSLERSPKPLRNRSRSMQSYNKTEVNLEKKGADRLGTTTLNTSHSKLPFPYSPTSQSHQRIGSKKNQERQCYPTARTSMARTDATYTNNSNYPTRRKSYQGTNERQSRSQSRPRSSMSSTMHVSRDVDDPEKMKERRARSQSRGRSGVTDHSFNLRFNRDYHDSKKYFKDSEDYFRRTNNRL